MFTPQPKIYWIVSCCSWAAVLPRPCAASPGGADAASLLQKDLQVSRSDGAVALADEAQAGSLDGGVAPTHEAQTGPTFAVLLTTYNSEDRQPMYTKRLLWWLRRTALPLFVVDSAGRGFPQSLSKIRSFKQLKFNQADVLGDFRDSTVGELLSLRRAWEAFRADWSRFDYVVKVTGKYVLPELQSQMKKVKRGNSFIIERYTDHPESGYLRWVNTEYLGFNAARMGGLVEKLTNNEGGALEDKLGQVLSTSQYPLQQLDSMALPRRYWTQRGIGDVLTAVLQTSDDATGHDAGKALE